MATTRRPRRLPRTVICVVAAVAVLDGGAVATAAPADGATQLRFTAAAQSVTLERWEGEPVWLELGTHVVAERRPFEIRVARASYQAPVVAKQVIRDGARQRSVRLPAGLVTDFMGLPDFTHLTITDATGEVVVDRNEDFCPNGMAVRADREAPDRSPYPWGCPTNPFTRGAVWGIQTGWGTPVHDANGEAGAVDLPDGVYTVDVVVNQPYRRLFGISQYAVTVELTIRTVDAPAVRRTQEEPAVRAAPSRPTGAAARPRGPRPDLRPLPAWFVMLSGDPDSAAPRDYLAFDATVWNAGGSPLVVDGFRRVGTDVMDAYQYFFDASGQQVGYEPVGTMTWDGAEGIRQWTFADFARYRLLDARGRAVVTSPRDAFCLANTDAIDYTVPGSVWQPANTDVRTSCGVEDSVALRQVLDIGNGDTVAVFQADQAFDVTELPNGTYFIEVRANPDNRLHESDTTNNVSRRRVVLGGEPGARTVEVPPHHNVVG
jgi:hypothetical protein